MDNSRRAILERFRAKIARGEPIIGGGAGTGLSAKSEEDGGIDLLIVYNSGRYRMAGRGSSAGLLAYGNANEIVKAMGFWLELGISGFRVDAVPFMIETTGVDQAELDRFPDPHEFLRHLRSFVGRRTGDGILLGEDGRKLYACTALLGADGKPLAVARQIWIQPRTG